MWAFKAQTTCRAQGMAEYAARKSDFFRKLKEKIIEECDEHVKVSGQAQLT